MNQGTWVCRHLGPQPEAAGPRGKEQSRDPPLADACTLPAAEVLGTDVHQAPPASSCKPPSPPTLTICAATYRTTSGFVVDRRLPSPPPMDVDALCLISDPWRVQSTLLTPAERLLVDVCSLVLFWEPGEEHTQRNRPARSQFQPKTNPLLSPPQTDRPSITPLSPLPTPSLPIFKDSFDWKSTFPLGPTDISPFPSCVDRDPSSSLGPIDSHSRIAPI